MLKQEHNQEDVKSGFVGEIRNNTITCDKLFIDTFNMWVGIEVSAELIQKDENLLIETTIQPRKGGFRNGNTFMKVVLIIGIVSLAIPLLLLLCLAIAKSKPEYLLYFLLLPVVWGVNMFLLKRAKEKALATATEELKKEFELAYLRARSS